MISFIQDRAAHSANNFAQNAEIRARANVQSLTSQMVGNICAVSDLITDRPRHRRDRIAAVSAAVSIRRQNLVNRRFVRVKIANIARSVRLNQIIHCRSLPRRRTITARDMQIISGSGMVTVG